MRSPIHLNALRAFEASARHGSFSGAAADINVTPTAVGQMVRGLEDWLGAPLFHRSASGRARLIPTEDAKRALLDIQAGFERLNLGLDKLKAGATGGILTVTVSPAFAAKWLLPRLERFQSRWPNTDVRLDTNLKLLDYATGDIDIGVRYGAGAWAGLTAVRLMDEEVYPVCSPSSQLDPRDPAELADHTLIHDLSVDASAGFVDWGTWLRTVGAREAAPDRGLRINNSAAVLQAAIDGHGVALARSVMARDDIAAGRLVRLFPKITFPASLAYYVVHRPERAALPKLIAFRDWLLEEAAAS